MGKIFGTDGARGVANNEITCTLAMRLGQAGALVLAEAAHHTSRILIGRDPRASGDMLCSAMIAGICSVGAHAIDLGVITTPGIAYLTKTMDVEAGVMLSASHNPMEDNGIKFFSHQGYKLSDALEERIERIVLEDEAVPSPTGKDIGRLQEEPYAYERYIDYLCSLAPSGMEGLTVVLDCANGAASGIAPQVFDRLGAQVHMIHCDPDGLNINEDCGSTHPESLQAEVLRVGADVGFAFDADADRLIAVDETGALVDGDQAMYILSVLMKGQGTLKRNTLVSTVMSNMGLELALKEQGIQMLRTAVGDRYVLEEMLRGGYSLGGEQSGHLILLEQATTGDGIVSALNLVRAMLESGASLSALGKVRPMPQILINVPIPNHRKETLLDDLRIQAHIQRIQDELRENGRILVRPSGTEALVRIMIEGESQSDISAYAEELAKEMARG